MSHSSVTDIPCWSCGHENTVVYGGPSNSEGSIFRCDECGDVIAGGGQDGIDIAESKEQSDTLYERYSSQDTETGTECLHNSEYIKPLEYNMSDDAITVTSFICLDCGEKVLTHEIRDGGLWN